MIYFLSAIPFIISVTIGILLIDLCTRKEKLPFSLQIFLSPGLGLGASAALTFMSYVFFGELSAAFVIALNFLLLVGLLITNVLINKSFSLSRLFPISKPTKDELILLGIMTFCSLPLWYLSIFYSYGGWDAWAVWNLKAKFLFLGEENWRRMFEPLLWRSSPHYPLLLPLMNVWGWCITQTPAYQVPVYTSFIMTFSMLGLIWAALFYRIKRLWVILPTIALITLPFFTKLSLSQYCDNIVGYYLLASFVLIFLTQNENLRGLFFLTGLSLGFLTFTKPEGFLAAGLIGLLLSAQLIFIDKKNLREKLLLFYTGALLAFIPTLLFKIFFAPENLTFINGFESETHPASWERVKFIFSFYLVEFSEIFWNIFIFITRGNDNPTYADPKWHGLWVFAIIGLAFNFRKVFHRGLELIPLFITLYAGAVTFYYCLNTYFEILWWMQVTLHRILFSLLPSVLFWMFYVMWDEKTTSDG